MKNEGKILKNIIKLITLIGLITIIGNSAEITVKVINSTRGISFTPILVAAHKSDDALFTLGLIASESLKAMAQEGNLTKLKEDLEKEDANIKTDIHTGLLGAGESNSTELTTDTANTNLSIVAMMLPTNDGFIALNNWKIPTTKGTYTVNINAYDSGTEANDELNTSIPGPATNGIGGTGILGVKVEGFVHIHRGAIGDNNLTGGKSDLTFANRWLNPVARAIITVK